MIDEPGLLTQTMVNRINALAQNVGYTVDPNEMLNLVWIGLLEAGLTQLNAARTTIANHEARIASLETTVQNLQLRLQQQESAYPIPVSAPAL